MKQFVENSLKELIKNREDIFGIRSEFLAFQYNEDSKGHQSDTKFGCIRYRNENGNILMSPALVLKSQPAVSPVIEALLPLFANEIFVYGHILPFFARLETSIWELFPKCYASFTQTYPQSSEALILMENLEESGYRHSPRKSFLDYAHLSLMVRNLGKYHAFSYLAKQLDPVRFHAHALSLNPIRGHTIGKFENIPIYGTSVLAHLARQSEYQPFIPVIQHLLNNANAIIISMLKYERNNPWAVVCHGDYLSPNVMFKYDKGQPVHLKMFDLSTGTFSSPALDLALVLYMHTDQETRDHYWDQLIDDYCDGLSSLPTVKLPSRDDIVKELESKAFYAFIIASYFLRWLVSEDFKLGSSHQFIPSEYAHTNYFELPEEVRIEINLKLAGDFGTNCLVDILKDMLQRGFIQNSSLSNVSDTAV